MPALPRLVVDFLHGITARVAEVNGLFASVWALTLAALLVPAAVVARVALSESEPQ